LLDIFDVHLYDFFASPGEHIVTLVNLYFHCIRYGIVTVLFFLPLFALLPRLAAADVTVGSASPQKERADPLLIQGYLSGKYVFRKASTSDQTFQDQDLFGELRLDLTKPQSNRYEVHFFGTARYDLDSNLNQKGYYPFEDIGNTYSSPVHGYLYEAHLDLNQPVSRITQLRIGRQDGNREEPVFFDGIAADIKVAQKVNMTLYGGAAIHYYEIDSNWGDDWLGGVGLDYFPLSGTALIMDYLYVDDKRTFDDTKNQHDSLSSIKLVQRFSPNLKATVKYRYLNEEDRDLKLRVVATVPQWDVELQAAYFRQFRTQYELSNELSTYFDVMGPYYPYESYDIKLRKMFGVHFAIDLGYFERSLLDTQQENAFNHAYRRTYAVIDLIDVLHDGLSFSLIGEQWKAGSQQYESAGFDAGYAFKKGRRSPKVNAGTYYSLYKYDYYILLGERTKVRTYYAKFELPFAQHYSVNGSYEFESGIEDYQTAKLGIRYEF
jgi:hypothetical protein